MFIRKRHGCLPGRQICEGVSLNLMPTSSTVACWEAVKLVELHPTNPSCLPTPCYQGWYLSKHSAETLKVNQNELILMSKFGLLIGNLEIIHSLCTDIDNLWYHAYAKKCISNQFTCQIITLIKANKSSLLAALHVASKKLLAGNMTVISICFMNVCITVPTAWRR